MRDVPWDHAVQIARLRDRIWLHLTPSADVQTLLLEAGALLQMRESDILTLGQVHFLLSDEVGALIADLPHLLRRLANTTELEEERSTERIRGTILWAQTISARATSGLRHAYVTAPARRAYQTPENELLV